MSTADGPADGVPVADGPVGDARPGPTLRRRAVRAVVVVLVVLVALRLVTALVGSVDWVEVAAALTRLDPWLGLPLLGALLLRQLLNAVPLTRYVPGLGVGRSMANDLTANLVATAAPPPADVVLRIAMFRSWGLDPVMGMAGVTLNSVKFYAVRFLAPVLGLLLLASQGLERRQWTVALLCGAVAGVLLGGLVLLLRGDHLAAWLGRTAGRVGRRFRGTVDPDVWAATLVDVRTRSADALRRGLLPSMLALVGMVLADALVLLLALRFVGVGPGALSVVDVVGGFLLVYPLTLLPLFGLGVLDALLLGAWVTTAGVQHEAEIVAAVLIWRTVTIFGTLLLGLVTLGWWRYRHRGAGAGPGPGVGSATGTGTTTGTAP